jgi:hypothetical protein
MRGPLSLRRDNKDDDGNMVLARANMERRAKNSDSLKNEMLFVFSNLEY